jgi:hypothetical protein
LTSVVASSAFVSSPLSSVSLSVRGRGDHQVEQRQGRAMMMFVWALVENDDAEPLTGERACATSYTGVRCGE